MLHGLCLLFVLLVTNLFAVDNYKCVIISGNNSEICNLKNSGISIDKMNNKGLFLGKVDSRYAAISRDNIVYFDYQFDGWRVVLTDISDSNFVIGFFINEKPKQESISFIWNASNQDLKFGPRNFFPHTIDSLGNVTGTLANTNPYAVPTVLQWNHESGVVVIAEKAITSSGKAIDKKLFSSLNIHGSTSDVIDINNCGVMIGTSFSHAIPWKYVGGDLIFLPSIQEPSNTHVSRINNMNQIVGSVNCNESKNITFGCIWEGNQIYLLDSLIQDGIHITWAQQINDKGQILAQALIDGSYVQVFLDPVR